ncbi:Structural maintenance of chromosomes 5 [Lecanosticta acicola]|uniref:Structural maintenance of chromosomes protein 5 n=1 Tax=Lecanosticta acicola TaxID=111012 RepID=A0AAI9EET6_9PEZI|nr:Structural maintenance of chromosomes 5 [Lecanosticta acicola]
MASPSVTPQRRARVDGPDTSDSEGGANAQSNKRRRLSDDGASGSEDEERPVLPNSFRRSPKGKGRARDAQEHHPGSIVRVTLTDFVTYTNAEFRPGPNLNMVIGPNGTGKSTLVCAICIGLGWSTSHLGRAKDIAEFVKHGKKSATIEIELKGDPARHSKNPVIMHKINRDGSAKSGTSKSVYLIDGKKSNNKAVQELARSFYIQVDNLCQFLPQDRVVEFAALSPVDLLKETQRAAAPEHMSQWHDELKTMGKGQRKALEDQQALIDDLKSKEGRQKSQEELVSRLRERNALQKKVQMLEKLKPFAVYQEKLNEYREARQKRKQADEDLRALQKKVQPNMAKINSKKQYLSQLQDVVKARQRLLIRTENDAERKRTLCEDTANKVEECNSKLEADKQNGRATKNTVNQIRHQIRDIERAQRNPPPDFDSVKMNEEIRAKTLRIREIENEMNDRQQEMESMKLQVHQRSTAMTELQAKRQDLESQAGRQRSKLHKISPDTATAWEWIESNRAKFAGEVYGPAVITCSVKNPRHASVVESVLGQSELLAFTVTSPQDFTMLQRELYTNQKLSSINIRSISRQLEQWQPPCDKAELERLGGESWVLDLIEGPPDVLAMLCDNSNVHATGWTSHDLDSRQWERLQGSAITSFVTPQNRYQIIRRREYGAAGTSTRVTPVKPARLLTDAPVDLQQEQEHEQRMIEMKGEVAELRKEVAGVAARYQTLEGERGQLSREKNDIEKDKQVKQKQLSEFNGLSTKLQNAQSKVNDAMAMRKEQSARRMNIINEQDQLCQERGQQALDYARAVDTLRSLHLQVLEAEIMQIEAKSDLEQLEANNAEDVHQLNLTQTEARELKATEAQLAERAQETLELAEALDEELQPEEKVLYQELMRPAPEEFIPEKLDMEIQSVQATLDMLHGGNENVIKEFEQRAQRIEELRQKLVRLEEDLSGLSAKITELRGRWEPELEEVVKNISDAFSENFHRIQCAGEVGIYKDDDYDQWAIQIKVKFRENEPLSLLDSHRQSGGERAVSTIFYLMALQSLARAPFRVVDEINQGMDPRNERLVHSRMVEIACAEHTSQYFLITPKLLNNLTYHENMKVHCIASGEYMPDDHQRLNFEHLAQQALALRAAQ